MSKDDIKRQARGLHRSGKFDPTMLAKETPDEQLRALKQEARSEQAFAGAGECEDCEKVRLEKNDPEALCRVHLSQALGF